MPDDEQLAARLRRLPRAQARGLEVPLAVGLRARTLGLAGLDRDRAGEGLLIPRCSSVHTFWMRFPLDLAFLDERGEVLEERLSVPPRRLHSHRAAKAVLELPAGG
jgi:uncharacterized membrane protein (UPF0127 family)